MPVARNRTLWPIVALLLGVFAWGAWKVIMAPLESGEVYPPYSTLRADPIGAKALFDSLTELRELSVSRLYRKRLPLDPETALFVLGVSSYSLASAPKEALGEYEKLLDSGGRIVIAFLPTYTPARSPDTAVMEQEWHIQPQYRKAPGHHSESAALPAQTALYFDPGTEWRVLRRNDSGATVVERDLRQGTLVLVADSFPLSNQGLSERADSTLIATIVGIAHGVMFDENHFGVAESGSVAILIHKYRLEGALALLLVVAGLFLWRNTTSFLPPREQGPQQSISGRDSHEGLAALLRRSLPETELLQICFSEWRRTNPRDDRLRLVETQIKQRVGSDPLEGYRAACRVLAEKK